MQLEVLDLEVCHFVQYRPASGEFNPMELNVTVVYRDRKWFESNLPLFQKFISDLDRLKRDLDELSDKYPTGESKEAPIKKRVKLQNNDDTPCLIKKELVPLPGSLIIN
tara:strand:+ start:1245 stop:1571 length:327 start_codon:yes stop_codon:yes gene_type:complete